MNKFDGYLILSDMDGTLLGDDREISQQNREAVAYFTKNGGRFALVHRPERLAELFSALSRSGLEPKRLQLIQHDADTLPSAVLVEAVRQGRPGLKVLPTLLMNRR